MSALYVGEVVHERLRPARHRLAYRVFMAHFDLDALESLSKRIWAFSYNRPGLISFYDRDHGDGSGAPLRPQIEAALRDAGIEPDGGPIRVLAMPRVLGYVFNPLSVFFCHGRDGSLRAVAHEVNNTFGERHVYVLPAHPLPSGRVEQACAKTFRVSPFLDLAMRYRFSLSPPAETTLVAITASDAKGPMLTAWFKGERRPLTTPSTLRQWLAHPALTLHVILGIHWEALLIWLKLKRAARRSRSMAAAERTAPPARA